MTQLLSMRLVGRSAWDTSAKGFFISQRNACEKITVWEGEAQHLLRPHCAMKAPSLVQSQSAKNGRAHREKDLSCLMMSFVS